MSDSVLALEAAVERLVRFSGQTPNVPRIDLDKIASALGVDVHPYDGVAEGRLSLRDGRPVVEINPNAPLPRRRFTFAHELGHAYFLHPGRDLPSDICRSWPTEEAFCNAFAAALLLPQQWLQRRAEDLPVSLDALGVIAHASGASLSACSFKLADSGLWRYALVAWALENDGSWRVRDASVLPPGERSSLRWLSNTGDQERTTATEPLAVKGRAQLVNLRHGRREGWTRAEVRFGRRMAQMLLPIEHANGARRVSLRPL